MMSFGSWARRAITGLALLGCGIASATTPDTSFPEVWFTNQVAGTGAQLSWIDSPGTRTGRTAFLAVYTTNEDTGAAEWVVGVFNPVPGLTDYTFNLRTSRSGSVGTFVPESELADSDRPFLARNVDLKIYSCNRMELTIEEGDYQDGFPLGAGTIEFLPFTTGFDFRDPNCPFTNEVPQTTQDTDPICAAGGGSTLSPGVCQVPAGTYTSDMFWANNVLWLYEGEVVVGEDAGGDAANPAASSVQLTVEAGATVAGLPDSVLVVQRGSRINAVGNKQSPIIFTSDQDADPDGTPQPGDVAGIVIAGRAGANCTADELGDGQFCDLLDEALARYGYGGNDDDDSSGIMRYVQIRYSGREVVQNREIQGLSLFGVGRGTTFEYIQVFASTDDGIEFFGGTAQIKRAVVVRAEDDSFDWGFGWRGKAQYVLIIQLDGVGDHGIEADSNELNFDLEPRAFPKLANFTIWGYGGDSGEGVRLRRGTGANISGFIIAGARREGFNIDDDETFNNGGTSATDLNGNLTVVNSIVFDSANGDFDDADGDPFLVSEFWNNQPGNLNTDPMLQPLTPDSNQAGYLPKDGSPVTQGNLNGDFSALIDDDFIDHVDYMGAIRDKHDLWFTVWTIGIPRVQKQ